MKRPRAVRALDPAKLRTTPRRERSWKVTRRHFGRPLEPGASVADLMDSLPKLLAAEGLRETVRAWSRGWRSGAPIIALVGAHVIKCGLGPVLCELIRRRAITAVAMNGAGAIHDFELARWGNTSENVDSTLVEGTFGLVDDTAREMNAACEAAPPGAGMGEALGRSLLERRARYRHESVLASCADAGIPITIHVAIGTDVIHQHPSASGETLGRLSLEDFRRLAAVVATLGPKGLVLNMGSAVILPEVFLKCVSTARNLGHAVRGFTAVNLDMVQHYRPLENVLRRPTLGGGRGVALTGHHEIMIPLLAAAVLDASKRGRGGSGSRRRGTKRPPDQRL